MNQSEPHETVMGVNSSHNLSMPTLPVDADATFDLVMPVEERVASPGWIRRVSRWPGRILGAIASAIEWCFGAAVLMVGLAVLAALPIVQCLSLGYLLECGARVARTGRIRDGFIGMRLAARIGSAVLGSWLLLLPVRFASDYARSAQIIDPGSPIARAWRLGLLLLIGATAIHIAAACARGGKLRYFAWPFNFVWLIRRVWRGGYYTEARDAVWDVVAALRLPYYFWLGLRGFGAAVIWLVVPVSLLALGRVFPPAGFLGAIVLAWVLLGLPFLQMRLAVENRFGAAFERKAARAEFNRAPWIASFAVAITLLTALPLYLLKIEAVPAEAAWLPSLVFVVFIFPARLATGWALSWARSRETPRHAFFRWTGRLALIPVAAFYVLVVYFTQFTSWHGIWSLYEQHAFLVPAPFAGL